MIRKIFESTIWLHWYNIITTKTKLKIGVYFCKLTNPIHFLGKYLMSQKLFRCLLLDELLRIQSGLHCRLKCLINCLWYIELPLGETFIIVCYINAILCFIVNISFANKTKRAINISKDNKSRSNIKSNKKLIICLANFPFKLNIITKMTRNFYNSNCL